MRNDLVRHAINQLNSGRINEARTYLYRHLSDGFLLLAAAEVPEGIAVKGTVVPQDTSISVLTAAMPGRGTALLAFTDIESLHNRVSKAPHIVMRSRDVLEMVVEQNYDALVLNAAGPWATVPREDIVGILEKFGPTESTSMTP